MSDPEIAPLATELTRNRQRLDAVENREFPRPKRPLVMTVSNQKGGVGKTTTTVNVAAGLAMGGWRVVVIDIDPQGNASTALGIEHSPGTPSVYDVLLGEEPLEDILRACPDHENLLVCPSTIDLAGAEVELTATMGREYLLRNAIEDFLQQDPEVDLILIDCPPSLGLLTLNAFVAAHEVLIPVQTEYYALEGLSLLLNTVERIRGSLNPELTVSTMLLTMVDSRTRLSAEVGAEVREHFPAQVLDIEIPRSVRVSEAPSYGQTAIAYDPRGAGSIAYREAALEIAERLAS